jgi:3-deoxy-manno-octulosonate cytidylyltransferase (CMP-KDO synthetase)
VKVICIPVQSGRGLRNQPLLKKGGRSLLRYTFEAACRARTFDRIIIATDSREVQQHAADWPVQIVETGRHDSRTERVAEAIHRTANCAEVVVSLQVNHPGMPGAYLDAVAEGVKRTGTITTLAAPLPELGQSVDENRMKVIVSKAGSALYFTRAELAGAYQQLGCYGFTVSQLERISKMPSSALATAERLEQLGWLDNGMAVSAIRVERCVAAINTQEDWEHWEPPTDDHRVII